MINPKDFISGEKQESESSDFPDMSGTFICQDQNCMERVTKAKLDESRMRILYVCSNGHKNEAKL